MMKVVSGLKIGLVGIFFSGMAMAASSEVDIQDEWYIEAYKIIQREGTIVEVEGEGETQAVPVVSDKLMSLRLAEVHARAVPLLLDGHFGLPGYPLPQYWGAYDDAGDHEVFPVGPSTNCKMSPTLAARFKLATSHWGWGSDLASFETVKTLGLAATAGAVGAFVYAKVQS